MSTAEPTIKQLWRKYNLPPEKLGLKKVYLGHATMKAKTALMTLEEKGVFKKYNLFLNEERHKAFLARTGGEKPKKGPVDQSARSTKKEIIRISSSSPSSSPSSSSSSSTEDKYLTEWRSPCPSEIELMDDSEEEIARHRALKKPRFEKNPTPSSSSSSSSSLCEEEDQEMLDPPPPQVFHIPPTPDIFNLGDFGTPLSLGNYPPDPLPHEGLSPMSPQKTWVDFNITPDLIRDVADDFLWF